MGRKSTWGQADPTAARANAEARRMRGLGEPIGRSTIDVASGVRDTKADA
jgi:hypothetical protein